MQFLGDRPPSALLYWRGPVLAQYDGQTWHGFEFHCGELIGLNRAQKAITIGPFLSDTGEALLPERELAYDILVLALGS
ncbi:hypothetical protein ABTN03_20080, partial [Acinetobacter baumannii]